MKESTIAISVNFQGIMEGLSNVLEEVAGEPTGFALLVFTEGRASYGSNCQREEVVKELKKLIDFWENGMPDLKAHEVQ